MTSAEDLPALTAADLLAGSVAVNLGAAMRSVIPHGSLSAGGFVLLQTAGRYTPLLTAVATCCALAAIGMTIRATTPAPQPFTAQT
ncbi:hypothetical protein OG470_22660 [Micromonospora sp. NBC_00389]|uniref:hypothetical protein n=1 Tax=Micromonospora sp. NBC_00389 TaxID=2903586 RepID=UPI002E1C1990